MRRSVVGVVAVLVLTTLFLSACATGSVGDAAGKEYEAVLKNLSAEDLEGKPLALQDRVGKDVIMMSFWATFCKPCKAEMPFLQKLHETYGKDGLTVVGVSLDTAETESLVRPFVERNNYTFAFCIDRQSDFASALNPKGVLPFLMVFDRKGRLVLQKDGFSTGDQPEMETLVKGLLAK
jgi:peroxiredoxin